MSLGLWSDNVVVFLGLNRCYALCNKRHFGRLYRYGVQQVPGQAETSIQTRMIDIFGRTELLGVRNFVVARKCNLFQARK